LYAAVELAIHVCLSASNGSMRSRSVSINGGDDVEAQGGGRPSVLGGGHRNGIVVVEWVEEVADEVFYK
jgi:hypothetical protein